MRIKGKLVSAPSWDEKVDREGYIFEPDQVQSVSVGDVVLARVRVDKVDTVEEGMVRVNAINGIGSPLLWVNLNDLVPLVAKPEPSTGIEEIGEADVQGGNVEGKIIEKVNDLVRGMNDIIEEICQIKNKLNAIKLKERG